MSLLSLPAELRERIYEYALTGHNIHILARGGCQHRLSEQDKIGRAYREEHPRHLNKQYRQRLGRAFRDAFPPAAPWHNHHDKHGKKHLLEDWPFYFTWVVCDAPNSDVQTHAWSRIADQSPDRRPAYNERHGPCMVRLLPWCVASQGTRGVGSRKTPHTCSYRTKHEAFAHGYRCGCPCEKDYDKLPVALLRTCKLICREASLMLYSGNTFSFLEALHLELFVSLVLNEQQRSAISSIILHSTWVGGSVLNVKTAMQGLEQSTVNMLQGLKSFGYILDNCSDDDLRNIALDFGFGATGKQLDIWCIVNHHAHLSESKQADIPRASRIIEAFLKSPFRDVSCPGTTAVDSLGFSPDMSVFSTTDWSASLDCLWHEETDIHNTTVDFLAVER